MTTVDDDRLLDELAAALRLEPTEPSAIEIAALRHRVAEQSERSVTPIAPRRRRYRRLVVAAAVAAALLLAGAAGAVATGTPLQHVLWGPADNSGAPVDSAALTEAKAAMRELQDALDGPDDTRVGRARDVLELQLARLSAGDRAQIDGEASDLLRRADERLGRDLQTGAGAGTGGREDSGSPTGEGRGTSGAGHRESGDAGENPAGASGSRSEDHGGQSEGTGQGGTESSGSGADHSGDGPDTRSESGTEGSGS